MRRQARFLLLLLAAALLPAATRGEQPAADEQALKMVGLPATGPGVLAFLRRRSTPAPPPDRMQALVQQLGNLDAQVSGRAAAELVGIGPAAVPWLRQAANDLDAGPAADRARNCLSAVTGHSGAAVSAAAVRTAGRLKPDGAAAALLAFLPFADDDSVSDEVGQALAAVGLHDGRADPALTAALADAVPVRRAAAGEVLARAGGPEGRAAARVLLRDPKPTVRLRVALALAGADDAEAVAVLIDGLADLPPAQVRQVEEYLTRLAGDWAVQAPAGDDPLARRLRRDVWAAWWRGLDGDVLLAEFRKHTLSDDDAEKARGLVRRLADPSPEERTRALDGLLALGPNVLPLLREAAAGIDPALRGAAAQCLEVFADRGLPKPLPPVAVRLLTLRRPPGTVEALLAYAPLADDENMRHELRTALANLARDGDRLHPALARGLGDASPRRRALAAEAVCLDGREEDRAAVRPLLKDAAPAVRLRAALALAGAGDRAAVPVLIALLDELPAEQAAPAEDYLQALAGDKAPDAALAEEGADAHKVRDAWDAWWRDKGAQAQLPRREGDALPQSNTLLIELYNPSGQGGSVTEVDRAGRVRWTVGGLQGPIDAQALPGGRVLIAEQNVQRLTERDHTGKVHWQKALPAQPLNVQRLEDGRTFIATRNELLEFDRAGKEVFRHVRPGADIMTARRLRDGQYAFVTFGWQYVRLDANGRPVKTARLRIPGSTANQASVEVLPHDRVLMAQAGQSRVIEIDLAGKVVWEAAVTMPMGVSRLPNGHTLVCSQNQQRVIELDRAGKVVWECASSVHPWRVRRG
jgi:HEAT repeat protein